MSSKGKRIMSLCGLILLLNVCSLEVGDFYEYVILETRPSYRNEVIQEGTPVSVLFRSGIDRGSAENTLRVVSPEGTLPGSWRWEGDRLIFHPDGSLNSGATYFLSISGSLRDHRGRIFPVQRSIPFSFGSSHGSLKVDGISPPSGTDLTARGEEIRLHFSLPVDRESFVEALSVSPWTELTPSWDEDSRSCSISPRYGWEDGTLYRLVLARNSLFSEEGAVLNENFESFFPVRLQSGAENTAELSIVSLDFVGGFPVLNPQPERVGRSETLLISFDGPVDRELVESLFTITPYCPGSLFWKHSAAAVFIPDRDFTPDTNYSLSLSPDFSFSGGEDGFITEAELPDVISVEGDPEDNFPADLVSSPDDPVLLSPSGPQGAYTFIFTYAAGVEDPLLRQKLQHRCGIDSLFPPDIPPPSLVGYMWTGPAVLMVQVSGLGSLHQNRSCYYVLNLPDGSTSGRRLYLRYEP